jgi:hypothetical protein
MFNKCICNVKMLKIAKEINAIDVISKIMAFAPPSKCKILELHIGKYKLRPFNEKGPFKTKGKYCCRYEKVKFIHDNYENIKHLWIEQECYTYKIGKEKSKNKNKMIVILHLKNLK